MNRFIYENGFVIDGRTMSITIRKIAEDLNLAVSTVSKALTDSYEISEETKQLVLDYAHKMNYVRNVYAGSLKNRKTKNVAVVLPEVADTFFSNAINGIDSVAQANGYHVMVYLTHERPEQEESILWELRGGRVDGILISVSSGIKSDSNLHAQLAKEMPLIFFDRVCEQVPAGKVLTDDFDSGYKAAAHLIARGCRNLAFLAAAGGLSIVDQRYQGFLKALQENDMATDDGRRIDCFNEEGACRDLIANALTTRKIDGAVCSVEKLAMSVYSICKEIGIAIPHDVKVIAFSNLQIASLLAPSLTTIEQPAFNMGKEAATMLFKSLKKKTDVHDQRIILPSVLLARDSTA